MTMTIRGGLDFIVHSALASYDHSVTRPLSHSEAPSPAGLLIDLVNCWNQVSRDECQKELERIPTLHGILPYFDLMYSTPNRCVFKSPDGSTDFFLQEDGSPKATPSCISSLASSYPFSSVVSTLA
jgi:hypothetical protein